MGVSGAVVLVMLGASAVCSSATASGAGSDEEVPVRIAQWSDDDRAWLEAELAKWLSERDRRLCTPDPRGLASGGLTIESTELEAVITFVFQSMRRTRTVPRGGDAGLFRYQVAAAAEELVRSTWEAPPPPRFALLGRGDFSLLAGGQWLGGGSLGVGLFVLPSLCVELFAHGAGVTGVPLPTGGRVGGFVLGGTLGASWLPLRLGVLRAGPRARLQAGALSLTVTEAGSPDARGTAPWLVAGGGLSAGVETRHLLLLATAELGFAFTGAAVDVEGVRVQSTRGLVGHFGVQAGWLW